MGKVFALMAVLELMFLLRVKEASQAFGPSAAGQSESNLCC
jgi:hypothetical protein